MGGLNTRGREDRKTSVCILATNRTDHLCRVHRQPRWLTATDNNTHLDAAMRQDAQTPTNGQARSPQGHRAARRFAGRAAEPQSRRAVSGGGASDLAK